MHLAVTARVLGFLLMIFSLTMLTPIIVAWIYGEQTSQTFLSAFAITLLVGLLFWFPAKNKKGELRTRDGFIVTVFFWLVLSTFGALPLMLSEAPNLSIMNAPPASPPPSSSLLLFPSPGPSCPALGALSLSRWPDLHVCVHWQHAEMY